MEHLSSMFGGLVRSLSVKKSRIISNGGESRETADAMMKEAKKNQLILKSSGFVNVEGSDNCVSVYSKRGEKGINQDCFIVWEEFGFQSDTIFCGIFDGHGSWGHTVAKRVRDSIPSSLLCCWQEELRRSALDKKPQSINNVWQQSYSVACAAVDRELEQLRHIDSFNSGTTSLTMVRQGNIVVLANVGDSRAVLGTMMNGGTMVAVQLTVDLKPDLPQEAARIRQLDGRVFCLSDEPGVHRMWLPNEESPGLAMSRAFGDYCVKDYGVISEPVVTLREVAREDRFIILATDGVWDVVSNEEAVQVVAAAERAKAAKRLVQYATVAWRRKRRGIAVDDISAVCVFLDSASPHKT